MATVSAPQLSSANGGDGDFNCNICLDVAMDPVVTLCGHLYCCPCIRKWLLVEEENIGPQWCPVCKATLSQDSLVHLYGRGSIPKRMRPNKGHRRRPPVRHHRLDGVYGGEFPSSRQLGEMEVGLYYSSRYHGAEGSGRASTVRRPEMEAERLLRIWLLVLCSAALYLLLF